MAKITTVDVNVNTEFSVKIIYFIFLTYEGGFGEVKKAVHKQSGVKYAVKLIRKTDLDEDEKERLINEVELLKKLVKKNVKTNELICLFSQGSSKYFKSERVL